jgi:DNA-binding CsgD family transcriptional regulator
VNGRKRFKVTHRTEKNFLVHPKAFVFIDKRTGTQRFEVKADANGKMPVDEAVSLLVVHCLMRNQMPNDFSVMVSAGENLLNSVRPRARKLIQACPSIHASFLLTSRQQEVFGGVQQGLSNKEIAKKLNLSERTVKFHVSSLLEKFDVAGRMGLMRKAADILSVVKGPTGVEAGQDGAGEGAARGQDGGVSRESLVQMNTLERRSRV